MILVTGATGMVGFHLLLQLQQQNMPVKALYRSDKKLNKIKTYFEKEQQLAWFEKISWLKTDILDIPKLTIAFVGVTQVYHCAALVSFQPKDVLKLEKTNIEGTANVVNLCLQQAETDPDFKLCYVSSIATLGAGNVNNRLIDEETDWNPELPHSDYAFTKFGAEMEVWRAQQERLNIVIINPGVIFGNYFYTEGSNLILKKIKQGLRFYTTGKVGIVAVNDVVKAMILLMNNNTFGERFIAVAQDISYQDLFTILAEAFNKKPPKYKVKSWVTKWLWKFDWFFSTLFFLNRSLTQSLGKSLHNKDIHTSDKLLKTINFSFTNMPEFLQQLAKKYAENTK